MQNNQVLDLLTRLKRMEDFLQEVDASIDRVYERRIRRFELIQGGKNKQEE